MWRKQVDVLSGKFTVIAPDPRGLGTDYAELAGLQEIRWVIHLGTVNVSN